MTNGHLSRRVQRAQHRRLQPRGSVPASQCPSLLAAQRIRTRRVYGGQIYVMELHGGDVHQRSPTADLLLLSIAERKILTRCRPSSSPRLDFQPLFLYLRILEDRLGNGDFILEVLCVSYGAKMAGNDPTTATA